MKSIILAGGKGSRLRPLTKYIPKSLAPILDKPIIVRIIESLVENGISEFVVVRNIKHKNLESVVNKWFENMPINLQYVTQDKPEGTAHAVRKAIKHLEDDFIVSSGDSLLKRKDVKRIIQAYEKSKFSCSFGLEIVETEEIPNSGIVSIGENNEVLKIIEKPTIEDAPSNLNAVPFYVLDSAIIPLLQKVKPGKNEEYNLQDAIQMLIDIKGPGSYHFIEERYNLTNLLDLKNINFNLLKNTTINRELINCKVQERVHIGPGPKIYSCNIGPNVYIQEGAKLEEGSNIQNKMVLRNVTV